MKITASAYLVQGFYFQERQFLGLGSMIGLGDAVVLQRGMTRNMFAGIIGREAESDEWSGELSDSAGISTLSHVRLYTNLLEFEKRYHNRGDSIKYLFSTANDDRFWTGRYSGDMVSNGYATCLLTPLPEAMLNPANI